MPRRIDYRSLLLAVIALTSTTFVSAQGADADGDGIPDSQDNCTNASNPDQLDADGDAYGNRCDGDLNNSGTVTAADLGLLRSVLGEPATNSPLTAAADLNGTGMVTTADYAMVRGALGTPPGPAAVDTAVVPLYDASTPLEPETTVDTPAALITRVADRPRDRHARESQFMAYDHYLASYWVQRMTTIEIVDSVAKGGTSVTFNFSTLAPLSPSDFRVFFMGLTTPAQYFTNLAVTSLGGNNYTVNITWNNLANRALQIGDRMEFEFSPFLIVSGRTNYYGTAILYIVGQGIVPWQGVGPQLDSFPLPASALLGGRTTLSYQYSNEPANRFKQMATNSAPVSGQAFMLGRRLHHTDFGNGAHTEQPNPVFTEQVGKLGPKYINRNCVACHVNNGRALAPAVGAPMLQSVVKVGVDATGAPHPTLGSVLQPLATSGPTEGSATIASFTAISGQYGDGTPYSLRAPSYAFTGTTPGYFSARVAPQLVGLGLLEAVSEAAIVALADPGDANQDGISGRVRTTIDPVSGQLRLGRFTYKGGRALVSHQIAGALNTDMGVTTSVFPILDGETSSTTPELADADLATMTRYVAALGVSARRDLAGTQALQGEQLFANAGCGGCHAPTLTTGPYHPMTELRNQTIHPYTDLLLHDLGPGLADNMGEGGASGAEWRTAPLWSIGLTAGVSGGESYLHDGRARTLEEAILWHDGEGSAARESFRTMSAADRAALIVFLKTL